MEAYSQQSHTNLDMANMGVVYKEFPQRCDGVCTVYTKTQDVLVGRAEPSKRLGVLCIPCVYRHNAAAIPCIPLSVVQK